MTPEQIRAIVQDELATFMKTDRFVFDQNVQLLDARNIQLGRTNGTMIGTAADQKLGFYGKMPVIQAASISNPSGGGTAGVDSPARNAVIAVITALHNLGLIQ